RVDAGRLVARLGENGAGKGTRVKGLLGYYRRDEGSVVVDGTPQPVSQPREAHALGMGMVYQHFTLVEPMTVAENLILSRAHVPAIVDWRAEHEALRQFMRGMRLQPDPARPVTNHAARDEPELEIL